MERGKEDQGQDLTLHKGGCHCRNVRFEVETPARVTAWDCNCSICSMKRNTHFIVPSSRFHLLPGSGEYLQVYQFGTRTAKHLFCKNCGICPFYIPRSNPDGVAVTVHCLDPGTLVALDVKQFDGNNWEEGFKNTDIAKESAE